MLFNSIEFLIFLPAVFLIYWLCLRGRPWRNIFIVGASYLFYGWWDWRFLLLIFLTSILSFGSGLWIDGCRKRGARLAILWGNVAVNIGILCLFKYFNFFAGSFASLMHLVGWEVDSVTLDLILPVGISFYTFQALSYSIDVYRRDITPTRDLPAFLSFISFFPQLVAGPIERSTNLLPQFLTKRSFDYPGAVEGMKLILWGLFKKMVIADNAATAVDAAFGNIGDLCALNLWIGGVLFAFQIYGDFSGYSDIAIGTARLFGIGLKRNFNLPYFAKGIHDFWQRWHISLTSWFRDYIYIPLGGNRKGRTRTVANTMIVFTLSGLWHGADLTFILWGAYHGILSISYIFSGKRRKQSPPGFFISTLMMGITFILVVIGWIIFRADNMHHLLEYLAGMFSQPIVSQQILGRQALAWCALLVLIELFTRKYPTPFSLPYRGLWRYSGIRIAAYALFFSFTLLFAGNTSDFIYFQF